MQLLLNLLKKKQPRKKVILCPWSLFHSVARSVWKCIKTPLISFAFKNKWLDLINLREFWLILFLESYHLICVADNVPVRGENSKGVFDILRGGEGGTVYSVHSVHSIQWTWSTLCWKSRYGCGRSEPPVQQYQPWSMTLLWLSFRKINIVSSWVCF